jgi:DNA-binding XRE family transcriptional regulator
MTPEAYKAHRMKLGTQEAVAKILEISRVTIARRETGALPINREAQIAIVHAKPEKKRNPKPRKK